MSPKRLPDKRREGGRRVTILVFSWIGAWFAVGIGADILGLFDEYLPGVTFAVGGIVGTYFTLLFRPILKEWVEEHDH